MAARAKSHSVLDQLLGSWVSYVIFFFHCPSLKTNDFTHSSSADTNKELIKFTTDNKRASDCYGLHEQYFVLTHSGQRPTPNDHQRKEKDCRTVPTEHSRTLFTRRLDLHMNLCSPNIFLSWLQFPSIHKSLLPKPVEKST